MVSKQHLKYSDDLYLSGILERVDSTCTTIIYPSHFSGGIGKPFMVVEVIVCRTDSYVLNRGRKKTAGLFHQISYMGSPTSCSLRLVVLLVATEW